MKTRLREILSSNDILTKLAARAKNTPVSAPVSLDIPLPESDDWLSFLPANQHFWYRAQPHRGEYRLALGHAVQIASAGPNRFAAMENAWRGLCEHWQASAQAKAFAGFAFADESDSPFPNCLLALPSLLLTRTCGGTTLTLTAISGRLDEASESWGSLLCSPAPTSPPEIRPIAQSPLAEQAWQTRINAALRDIASGRIKKVVLSRQSKWLATQPVSPACLLQRLNAQQAGSVIFAYGNGRQTFLGATPERLLRLNGQRIEVDALAGTAWPGSPQLDIAKNIQEQAVVVDAVYQALTACCINSPEISSPEERAAGELRHLRSCIVGQVRDDLGLFDLIRQIHPTPAVGGYPTAQALAWLAAHREKRSAWYSGGFGELQPNGDAEFSVALRSALLDGTQIELQAGAGIVAGSDAQQEWAEIEAKFGTLQKVLMSTPYDFNRAA